MFPVCTLDLSKPAPQQYLQLIAALTQGIRCLTTVRCPRQTARRYSFCAIRDAYMRAPWFSYTVLVKWQWGYLYREGVEHQGGRGYARV